MHVQEYPLRMSDKSDLNWEAGGGRATASRREEGTRCGGGGGAAECYGEEPRDRACRRGAAEADGLRSPAGRQPFARVSGKKVRNTSDLPRQIAS